MLYSQNFQNVRRKFYQFPQFSEKNLEISKKFLENFGNRWNISLFHYRNIGSAYGNILIGIEDPSKNKASLFKHINKCGALFNEVSNNRAYLDFLK